MNPVVIIAIILGLWVCAFGGINNVLDTIWKRRVLNMVRDREVMCAKIAMELGGSMFYGRAVETLRALAHEGELNRMSPLNQPARYRMRPPL